MLGNKKLRGRFKRSLLVGFVLLLLALLLGWVFLPRIAERLIRGMIADAGLRQNELRVVEIGWSDAVIGDLDVAGDGWSMQARRIRISYGLGDLVAGRIDGLSVDGLVAEIDLESDSESMHSANQSSGSSKLQKSFQWFHALPTHAERVGSITAQDAKLSFKRGQEIHEQTLSIHADHRGSGKLAASIDSAACNLDLGLATSGNVSELTVHASVVAPSTFITLVEFLTDADEPFVPEGVSISGAEMTANIKVDGGAKPMLVTGQVTKCNIAGQYDGKPMEFTDLTLDVQLANQGLSMRGAMTHAGTEIPFRYSHTLKDLDGDQWLIDGEAVVGPIEHTQALPGLSAVADVLSDISLLGHSETSMSFRAGSDEPFKGVIRASLRDAEVIAADGALTASGLNGVFELHMLPQEAGLQAGKDPGYYTIDFSANQLHVGSKDALDYDLVHEAELPVSIVGKGSFGAEGSILDAEIKNLTLYGEKNGSELILDQTTMAFQMSGDALTATGSTSVGRNTIPFSYSHELISDNDDWKLSGVFRIDLAELNEPIGNGAMFVESMAGMTLAGKISLKMDFTTGNDQAFDGALMVSLADGVLTIEDDGPVIDGLDGAISLASLKEMKMAGPQRVTAKSIRAFDLEMSDLQLDYQILADGGVSLKNIALRALGGVVSADPFVLPGGDENYEFLVRMKGLDLAALAKLFPDFNGSISGKIDGVLPLQNIDGDFHPVRGGMYLTPKSLANLHYDAGNKFSAGIKPNSEEYKKMKMVEDSLKDLQLEELSIRLFDPEDDDKALVLKLKGQARSVPGSPPIHLNINGFKPDDDTVDFFDLLLKHRDKLNFGL